MAVSSHATHVIDHPSEHLRQGLDTAVEGALWSFEPLRTTKSLIGIAVDPSGVVTLRGNVVSDMMRSVAGRLAASVPGVRAVTNELVSDAQIEDAAAEVLRDADGRLTTDRVDLVSRTGIVYLGGSVTSSDRAATEAALADAATRIEALPGVLKLIRAFEVVEGGEEAGREAEGSGTAPAAADAGATEIQERLRIWRERAAASG
jgi:osmotically-inducible protein OsmY